MTTRNFTTTVEVAARLDRSLDRGFGRIERRIRGVRSELDRLGGNAATQGRRASVGFDRMSRDLREIGTDAQRARREIERLGTAGSSVRGVGGGGAVPGRGSAVAGRAGGGLLPLGGAISRFIGPLAGGFTAIQGFNFLTGAVREFSDLEFQFNLIESTTGEAAGRVNDLEREILRLGATTALTSRQYADAALNLARAGQSASAIEATLPVAGNIALTTGQDPSAVAAGLAAASGIFGFEQTLRNQSTFGDILTVGAGNTLLTADQLLNALTVAGPSSLQFDPYETIAGLAAISQTGLDATRTGTSFRRIQSLGLETLINPARQRIFTQAGGNVQQLEDAINSRDLIEFVEAFRGIDRGALNQIFGERGILGITALLNNTENLVSTYNNVLASQGAAQRRAEIATQGSVGPLAELASTAEALRTELGRTVLSLGGLSIIDEVTASMRGLLEVISIDSTPQERIQGAIEAYPPARVIAAGYQAFDDTVGRFFRNEVAPEVQTPEQQVRALTGNVDPLRLVDERVNQNTAFDALAAQGAAQFAARQPQDAYLSLFEERPLRQTVHDALASIFGEPEAPRLVDAFPGEANAVNASVAQTSVTPTTLSDFYDNPANRFQRTDAFDEREEPAGRTTTNEITVIIQGDVDSDERVNRITQQVSNALAGATN